MEYPMTIASLRARYPDLETTLYTSHAASNLPASMWTHDHCADIFAIRNVTAQDAPQELVTYLHETQRRFRANRMLFEETTAYSQGDEICIPNYDIAPRTPLLTVPYLCLSFAIENPPQITPVHQRAHSTRDRAPVARPGYVQDMSMVDFGTSDPISSEHEIPDETYTVRQDESGKQEMPIQFYGLAWLLSIGAHYRVGNAGPSLCLEYVSKSRRMAIDIPGAQLTSEARDDGGAVWRCPDPNTPNGRMTSPYKSNVLSVEAKSNPKDAFAQWAAELVGQMLEVVGYSKMDCNDPVSIANLTDAQRTKFVLSIQGVEWRWVWATFSVEWIEEFLGSNSLLGKRARLGDSASESGSEPELPGPIDDQDVMSGVEQEETYLPHLKINCSRLLLFTVPAQRFGMLVSSLAALQFAIDNDVEAGQAFIAESP